MYAMTALGQVGDNSDVRPFELNQYSAWYLLAGIEEYLQSAMWECQYDTLLDELERLRKWDEQFGGYYDPERYTELAGHIRACRADVRRYDIWVDNTDDRDHG